MEAFSSWKKLKVKNNCIDIISGKQENDRKLQREGRDGPPVLAHALQKNRFTAIYSDLPLVSLKIVGNIFFNQHFTANKY